MKLFNSTNPELIQGEYVFCCIIEKEIISKIKIIESFNEKEGITYILQKTIADQYILDTPLLVLG